jgi:hypothetical protein
MRGNTKHWIILAAALALAQPAHAFDWDSLLRGIFSPPASEPATTAGESLSTAEINAALKEALTRGAEAAVRPTRAEGRLLRQR